MSHVPEAVADLIRTATLAPSSHNTQPWRFDADDHRIDVYLDEGRLLAVNDPAAREAVISCGAALLTLRVAAAAAGHGVAVRLTPDPGTAGLLARVTLTPEPPDASLAALHDAVPVRRTQHGPFGDGPLPAGLLDRLAAAVAAERATLAVVEPPARRLVAGLVAEGDRRQFHDPAWRRELAEWQHNASAEDGLRTPRLVLPAARAAIRHLDLGAVTSRRDADLVWGAPALAVLVTTTDTTRDWLRAGQALQRALLVAAKEGVSAGFLNQPCQVGGVLRERLALAAGSPHNAQVLMRLGRPRKAAPATGRRPVDAALRSTG